MKQGHWSVVAVLLVGALLSAGCSQLKLPSVPKVAVTASPAATTSALPTISPTLGAETATAEPTVAVTQTVEAHLPTVSTGGSAPAPAGEAKVKAGVSANVRKGPATTFTIVGAATAGETYPVTGKSADGEWWQITYKGEPAWIFGQLVTVQGGDAVPVAGVVAVPTAGIATPKLPVTLPATADVTGWVQGFQKQFGALNIPYAQLSTLSLAPKLGDAAWRTSILAQRQAMVDSLAGMQKLVPPAGCAACGDVNTPVQAKIGELQHELDQMKVAIDGNDAALLGTTSSTINLKMAELWQLLAGLKLP